MGPRVKRKAGMPVNLTSVSDGVQGVRAGTRNGRVVPPWFNFWYFRTNLVGPAYCCFYEVQIPKLCVAEAGQLFAGRKKGETAGSLLVATL